MVTFDVLLFAFGYTEWFFWGFHCLAVIFMELVHKEALTSLDQCRQQCPYAHRLEYVRLSTTFLLPSGQHSDPGGISADTEPLHRGRYGPR
jgi:hypothetical protein